MSPELLLENISSLPPIARQEIFDFVSFLLYKYKAETSISDTANQFKLSDKGKEFIDKRLALMESNPKALSSWEDVKQRLYKKHNWKSADFRYYPHKP